MSDIEFLGTTNEYNIPISMGAVAGDFFFTWGYGELVVDDDPKDGVRKVFEHLKGLLAEKGLTFADVVRATCMCTRGEDFVHVKDVACEFLREPFPALTCFPIVCSDVIYEIDLIAYKRGLSGSSPQGSGGDGIQSLGSADADGWPLARAVTAGGYLYSSDWGNAVDPGNPEPGMRNVFEYFSNLLGEKGMTFEDVIQFTCMVTREDLIEPFEAMYQQTFKQPSPLCATFCYEGDDVAAKAFIVARQDARRQVRFTSGSDRGTESALVDDFLFVSNHTEKVDPADPKTNMRKVFERHRAVLAKFGLTFADVVKATVRVSSYDFFQDYQAVYREYFQMPYPARTTYGSVRADPILELDVLAYKKGLTEGAQ